MVNQPTGNLGLRIFWCDQILSWALLQGQPRIAKLKSVYNSLIIGPRGLQCKNQLIGNHGLGIF